MGPAQFSRQCLPDWERIIELSYVAEVRLVEPGTKLLGPSLCKVGQKTSTVLSAILPSVPHSFVSDSCPTLPIASDRASLCLANDQYASGVSVAHQLLRRTRRDQSARQASRRQYAAAVSAQTV